MNLIFKKIMPIITMLLLTACINSDNSGSSDNQNTENTMGETGGIVGKILNANTGDPLQNVNIRAFQITTESDESGNFTLQEVTPDERVVVTFSLAGYAEQSKVIQVQDQNTTTSLPILMLPVATTQTFDSSVPQTLSVDNSPAKVFIDALSLVKLDGTEPTGEVTVEITPIDPTVDIDLMPGDMKTDIGAGTLAPIESFGALNVVFRDSEGNDLNLSEGSNATIRIPVTNRTGIAPPSTIPLYFYNESTGLWVEEGNAILDATTSYYEGTVSHFSTWNADILYEQVQITGWVENEEGVRMPNVYVVSEGDDYSGTDYTFTDAEGNFSIGAKTNAIVLIVGLENGVKTNTVSLSTTTSNFAMESGLVLSTGGSSSGVTASIKLSWGENPLDLDSHYIGPAGSDIHIYYSNRGSLTGAPFANLDIDDTSSFGPEVITIFNFPQAGIYRYSVHNYSGSYNPGITDSPAIVELNINGNVSLFTPPTSGEGNNVTWDVFEFLVNENGEVTINPVNTWSDIAPAL